METQYNFKEDQKDAEILPFLVERDGNTEDWNVADADAANTSEDDDVPPLPASADDAGTVLSTSTKGSSNHGKTQSSPYSIRSYDSLTYSVTSEEASYYVKDNNRYNYYHSSNMATSNSNASMLSGLSSGSFLSSEQLIHGNLQTRQQQLRGFPPQPPPRTSYQNHDVGVTRDNVYRPRSMIEGILQAQSRIGQTDSEQRQEVLNTNNTLICHGGHADADQNHTATKSTTWFDSRRRIGVGSILAILLVLLYLKLSVHAFVQHPVTSTSFAVSTSRIPKTFILYSQTKDEILQDTESQNDDVALTPSLPQLHQEIFQHDPEWYREYVVDILGDSYCMDRWPFDTSKMYSATPTNETPAIADPSPPRSGAAYNLSIPSETPNAIDSKLGLSVNKETRSEDKQKSKITTTKSKENPQISTEKVSSPRADTRKERHEAAKIESQDTTVKNATIKYSDIDNRIVVYRNIVGNALTYVPMQNLTNLGYSLKEVEKMQSDSLCVVVSDQIRNPRMGVPLQWCIQDKNAQPQVQVVDSLEEAMQMIQDDKATQSTAKRQEREAKGIATEMKSIDKNAASSQTSSDVDDDERKMESRQRRSGPPRADGTRRKNSAVAEVSREQNAVSSTKGSLWHNGASEQAADNGDEEALRRPDRRRSTLQRDGTPKPIYSGRDPYRNAISRKAKDRGDPPSPKNLWMDFDTFKELLRKEAEFRMRIAGEGFAADIKRESDWRLQLYRNWLWAIHDGIGESVVPPSRYERARRMQRRGGVYAADRDDGRDGDKVRISSERATPKRKSRGSGPPRPR
jgi:hypothetical protein